MLIGHSIAQSVHLMQRSSSRRNIPRKRSEGIFFCSGYWIVTFFLKKWRPVTESPSKRSRRVSLSSHFFRAMESFRSPRGGGVRVLGGEAVAPRQRLPQPRQQEHHDEEKAENPGEGDHACRPAGCRQDREGDDDDVDEPGRDHPLPPERHELVEAVPRERRAEPDVEEDEE